MIDITNKIKLLSGKNEWETQELEELGINSIRFSDGPHGVRKLVNPTEMSNVKGTVPSTCFPTLSSLANTFNVNLAYRVGEGIAKECVNQGVDVILGPGLNIKRNPLCGRNFEYFSEDPFLTGYMASSYVKGVQSLGVGACVKHFACNNQETGRFINNSVVDERTLREIYLTAFETVIKEAKPYCVMASYNKLNGLHTTENEWLLKNVLRNDFGFDGVVISDWCAVNSRVNAIKAGLDIDMPGSRGFFDEEIRKALEDKVIEEKDIDAIVNNIKNLSDKLKNKSKEKFDLTSNSELAEEVSDVSIVLLRNIDNFLPLSKEEKYLVIGELFDAPRIQGGGSSDVVTKNVITPRQAFDEMGIKYDYVECYQMFKPFTNRVELNQVKKLVKKYDKVILFIGLGNANEFEGVDREGLDLPLSQLDVAVELCDENPNTLVVLQNGSPVTLPFIEDTKAIISAGLFGEKGGRSLAKIIFGEVSPSGRIAETYPLSQRDTSSFYTFANDLYTTAYEEGIFVGYRYYESAKKEVLFPFGYGLSYSSFEYSNLNVVKEDEYDITVSVDVKNIGSMKAKEVVLLFVNKDVDKVYRSITELKGFDKIELDVNETKTVTFKLNKRSFSFYDVERKDFAVEQGEYKIVIAKDAHTALLSSSIQINGDKFKSRINEVPSYYDLNNFSSRDLEILMNERILMPLYNKQEPVTMDSTLLQISKKSIVGGQIISKIKAIALQGLDPHEMTTKAFSESLDNQTFRSIVLGSSGRLNRELAEKILKLANSDLFDALKEAKELMNEFKKLG